MKVKLGQIVDAMPAMAVLAQEKMPARAAYRIGKLVRKMNVEHNDFLRERNAVVRKHVSPEDAAAKVLLSEEQKNAAEAEIQALLDEEVELEGCIPVAWADVDGLSLPPAVLADLSAFVEPPPA